MPVGQCIETNYDICGIVGCCVSVGGDCLVKGKILSARLYLLSLWVILGGTGYCIFYMCISGIQPYNKSQVIRQIIAWMIGRVRGVRMITKVRWGK